MNIGIITYAYFPEMVGGAELQALKLAQKLALKNHSVTVFAGSRANKGKEENHNLKIIKIKYRNIKFLRIFLSQLIAFLPEIKKEAPNLEVLLCYQVSPAGIIGLLSKLIFKIPMVTWIRAESEYKSFLQRTFFTPILLKYSDKFIVQTAKIKKDITHLYSKKFLLRSCRLKDIRIIPNGVETDSSQKIEFENREGVLFVGRLEKVKGVNYLIRAMKGVGEKLFIIGNGPEKNKLVRLSNGLDVEFLGTLPHDEIFHYLRRAKLLVLPSLSEAFPNILLEAMSVGLPVVATRVGGVEDVVIHERTGFLVKPKNPEQIRNYIQILLKNRDLWTRMSRECLQEVVKYGWPNIMTQFENILKEISFHIINN